MNNLADIVAYHKSKQNELSKVHYYCQNCGEKFDFPSQFKSCDLCNSEFKMKKKYNRCKKCGASKSFEAYGLCLKCFNYVIKQEDKIKNITR